jgi:hypothetical protein
MNTMKSAATFASRLGATVLLALGVAGCASSGSRSASETAGSVCLHPITTTDEEQRLKSGDSVAMVCTKCKSVVYLNITRSREAALNPLELDHPCAGCKATIKRVRVGKGHQTKITHICEKCGDDSVFCCATKHTASGPQGTEPEK